MLPGAWLPGVQRTLQMALEQTLGPQWVYAGLYAAV